MIRVLGLIPFFVWAIGAAFFLFNFSAHVSLHYGEHIVEFKALWLWFGVLVFGLFWWLLERFRLFCLAWLTRRKQKNLSKLETDFFTFLILGNALEGQRFLDKNHQALSQTPTGTLLLAEALFRGWLSPTMEGWVEEALKSFPELKNFLPSYRLLAPSLAQSPLHDVEIFAQESKRAIERKTCPRSTLKRYITLFVEGCLPPSCFDIFLKAIEQWLPSDAEETLWKKKMNAQGLYQMSLTLQKEDPLREEVLLRHSVELWFDHQNPALMPFLLLLFQKNNLIEMREWIEKKWAEPQGPWIEGAFLYAFEFEGPDAINRIKKLTQKNPHHPLSHYLLWEKARDQKTLPRVYEAFSMLEQRFTQRPIQEWPAWLLPLKALTHELKNGETLPSFLKIHNLLPLKPSSPFWALVEQRTSLPFHERLDLLLNFR